MINQIPINVLSELQLDKLLTVPLDGVATPAPQDFLVQYLQILEQTGAVEPGDAVNNVLPALALALDEQGGLINTQDISADGDLLPVVLGRNDSVQGLPLGGNRLPLHLLQSALDHPVLVAKLPAQMDGVREMLPGSNIEHAMSLSTPEVGKDGAEWHQPSATTATVSQPATASTHALYLTHTEIESGTVFASSMQETSSVLSRDLTLEVPMGQPKWDQALGNRVLWMINHDHLRAELRLNPPQLGPLDVRINIEGEQTNIHFSSPHGLVRESLESALPQLREMLSETGLYQVDVNVSHQSLTDQRREASSDMDRADHNVSTDAGDSQTDALKSEFTSEQSGVGLVDYYI